MMLHVLVSVVFRYKYGCNTWGLLNTKERLSVLVSSPPVSSNLTSGIRRAFHLRLHSDTIIQGLWANGVYTSMIQKYGST